MKSFKEKLAEAGGAPAPREWKSYDDFAAHARKAIGALYGDGYAAAYGDIIIGDIYTKYTPNYLRMQKALDRLEKDGPEAAVRARAVRLAESIAFTAEGGALLEMRCFAYHHPEAGRKALEEACGRACASFAVEEALCEALGGIHDAFEYETPEEAIAGAGACLSLLENSDKKSVFENAINEYAGALNEYKAGKRQTEDYFEAFLNADITASYYFTAANVSDAVPDPEYFVYLCLLVFKAYADEHLAELRQYFPAGQINGFYKSLERFKDASSIQTSYTPDPSMATFGKLMHAHDVVLGCNMLCAPAVRPTALMALRYGRPFAEKLRSAGCRLAASRQNRGF